VPAGSSWRRVRWIVWAVALLVGVLAGVLIVVLRTGGESSPTAAVPALQLATGPAATWPAGAKPAPDFRLTDQAGQSVSLARFRGRPVILTFIDPLCRSLCPREAREIDALEAQLPASRRPAIVAVSVNQWANARRNLLTDVRKWKLTPQWHWAVGAPAALERVWRSYQIAVQDSPKTVTGVTVHDVSHTEAAYVIDARGNRRALFLWPFRAADLASALRGLGA
jgi:protein SCO1/2